MNLTLEIFRAQNAKTESDSTVSMSTILASMRVAPKKNHYSLLFENIKQTFSFSKKWESTGRRPPASTNGTLVFEAILTRHSSKQRSVTISTTRLMPENNGEAPLSTPTENYATTLLAQAQMRMDSADGLGPDIKAKEA